MMILRQPQQHYLLRRILMILLIVAYSSSFVMANQGSDNDDSPEALFRQTAFTWQKQRRNLHSSLSDQWNVWYEFSKKLYTKFNDDKIQSQVKARLEIVGAIEEGILMIERSSIEREQAQQRTQSNNNENNSQKQEEEKLLSVLYSTYGTMLMNLTPTECLGLALDDHTLLIGAERVKEKPKSEQIPDTFLCRENAENHFRNSITLDATNIEAEKQFHKLIGGDDSKNIHERKPKEFVAELFDSFADTFDDKLLVNLEYKVPELVGRLAKELLLGDSKSDEESHYNAVLDAGCGTGLAGRYIRPLISSDGVLVGVDASQKMLDKAKLCTLKSGCGLAQSNDDDDGVDKNSSPPLYDALLNMDLEDMDLSNSLYDVGIDFDESSKNKSKKPDGYDLIVAADVLVYFGNLENLIKTYASISINRARLIFSCELATNEEAPLGFRLLSSGRFAHTKDHAIKTATKFGYTLIYYKEIIPRTEKGEPVRGHLFGFELLLNNENKKGTTDEL